MLEEAGRGDVRAEAEVGETPLLVDGDPGVALLPDELDLEVLALLPEEADGLFLVQDEPLDGDVLGRDLLHSLFDGLQVLGGERGLAQKVVVVAVLDRRADPGLGFRIEVQNGVRQEVRGAVPEDVKGLGRVRVDEADLHVGLDGEAQVQEPVSGLGQHGLPARAPVREGP